MSWAWEGGCSSYVNPSISLSGHRAKSGKQIICKVWVIFHTQRIQMVMTCDTSETGCKLHCPWWKWSPIQTTTSFLLSLYGKYSHMSFFLMCLILTWMALSLQVYLTLLHLCLMTKCMPCIQYKASVNTDNVAEPIDIIASFSVIVSRDKLIIIIHT